MVFVFGAAFAFVDAFLVVAFSGATALLSTTFLGRPRFFTAGGSTVTVAEVAVAIVARVRSVE